MNAFHHTLDQLSELKLNGVKTALIQQMEIPSFSTMTFEERLSHLIAREITERHNRKIKYLLSRSQLKQKSAFVDDIDYSATRNIHKSVLLALLDNNWIQARHNIIITGATGTGKTYLACALGNNAIVNGYSVLYCRVTKLLTQIQLVRGDGSYLSWLAKLAKFKVLILDDFGSCPLKVQDVQELLEVIEERSLTGSIIITSQLDVKNWHDYLTEPTVADAILDRLVHNSHRFNLKGESMRILKNTLSNSDTLG
jgi:DNA replication protein DnaC